MFDLIWFDLIWYVQCLDAMQVISRPSSSMMLIGLQAVAVHYTNYVQVIFTPSPPNYRNILILAVKINVFLSNAVSIFQIAQSIAELW